MKNQNQVLRVRGTLQIRAAKKVGVVSVLRGLLSQLLRGSGNSQTQFRNEGPDTHSRKEGGRPHCTCLVDKALVRNDCHSLDSFEAM